MKSFDAPAGVERRRRMVMRVVGTYAEGKGKKKNGCGGGVFVHLCCLLLPCWMLVKDVSTTGGSEEFRYES